MASAKTSLQFSGDILVNEPSLTAEAIFKHAQEIVDAEERRAYLDQACGSELGLREHVEKLLHSLDENSSCPNRSVVTLDTGNVEPRRGLTGHAPLMPTPEMAGSRIGPYKLLQQVGEGGMGVVFMAEQQEPVRRMVALKVIKAGMDSGQVIARFEAERQALALMEHPNIAKVLDANKTENGRPYFVMELVKGVPITKYCDEQRLTLRQRLELFVPVCQAIQHAHQKGIIHRDIKPSNVLVTVYDGKPAPKVIDFGVAKAMGQKLTERTLFTGFGGVIGTLEYMSPEQAEFNALDIDTRSDVYSLGVLLYELLTGTTPLTRPRLKNAAFTEVLRWIREEEAPRPSTRLSATKESLASVSAQRQMEPTALVQAMRGEMDWIVMKALEKDRTRRYETASSLARDIERYLADEPVEAGPPSATYRLRKLAWKHRRGLATAAALLMLLVVGTIVSTALAVWAMRAEQQARTAEADAKEQRDKALAAEKETRRSEEDAKAVLRFFQDKVLSAGRPEGQEGGLGNTVTLRKAVDAAEPEIVKSFADRPLVEAAIRNTLGTTYWYLGEYPEAIKQYQRAATLRESKLGADHADTLDSRDSLGEAYLSAGRVADAIRLFEQNLKQRQELFGADHPDTTTSRDHLALAYQESGRVAEAVPLHEQNLKQREAHLGTDHPDTFAVRNNLANAYLSVNRIADAIGLHQQNLRLHQAKFGTGHPDTLTARNNLAEAYLVAGRSADAIPLLERTLQQKEATLGVDHPETLASRHNLANGYRSAGRIADAIQRHEQNLKLCEAKLGADHPHTLVSRDQLAAAYDQAGEFTKAEPIYRQLVEQTSKHFGPTNPATAARRAVLGSNQLHQHKYVEAEANLRDALKVRRAKQPDVWTTFNTQSLLGEALLGQKRFTEAEPLLLSGYQGMKRCENSIPPRSKVCLSEALERLIQLYEAIGKKKEADKWRKEIEEAKNSTAKETKP
jgi:serine/threonine protein kinase